MTAFFQYEELIPIEIEKIQLWIELASAATGDLDAYKLAAIAAEWGRNQGADAELEACCEWLFMQGSGYIGAKLFAARRPKPLSVKQQVLMALDAAPHNQPATGGADFLCLGPEAEKAIRRALEQLPDEAS